MKTAYFNVRDVTGFEKWSLTHTPGQNDNDPAGGGRPVAFRGRAAAEPTETPLRPWLMQGKRNIL